MSIPTVQDPQQQTETSPIVSTRRMRTRRPGLSILAHGEPMLWLTGGSLALCLAMIVGLLLLVLLYGMTTFWPLPIVQVQTLGGDVYMGEVTREQSYPLNYDRLPTLSEQDRKAAGKLLHPVWRDSLHGLLANDTFAARVSEVLPTAETAMLRRLRLSPQLQGASEAHADSLYAAVAQVFQPDAERIARLQTAVQQAIEDESGRKCYQLWLGFRAVEGRWLEAEHAAAMRETFATDKDLAFQVFANQVLAQLSRDVSVPVRRRLIRTGNFELTNTHFHWVSDYQIVSQTETQPEWATLVERVEWGRFYGVPTDFAMAHPRTVFQNEQDLKQILQFLQTAPYRLSDADKQGLAAELEELPAQIKELQLQLHQTQRKHADQFVERFPKSQNRSLEVVLENGQTVPWAEWSSDQAVKEVREVWTGSERAWQQFHEHHDKVRQRYLERRTLEKYAVGEVNRRMEDARLDVRRAELDHRTFVLSTAEEWIAVNRTIQALQDEKDRNQAMAALMARRLGKDSSLANLAEKLAAILNKQVAEQLKAPVAKQKELQQDLEEVPQPAQEAVRRYVQIKRDGSAEVAEIQAQIAALKQENDRFHLTMRTAQGQPKLLRLDEIVRAYPANQLSSSDKLAVYGSRWSEFLTDDPREANSEGGVFPAIWGTVAMTLIMSLVVVPFGVLAALYLREYAKAGPIVSAVRISINNLAGVPSIVFGVFGLGFFCYVVGAYIDGGPQNSGLPTWPPATWFAGTFALAFVAVGAFVAGIFSLTSRHAARHWWKRWLGYASIALWLVASGLVVLLMATTPYYSGMFEASLPNPTFGKGGLVWASLTLALLTLPVVIVATEEALSAVPNSLREGSFACGASKWQTIRRIVLPHAMPGIMTGMILAMARGAGEVAPLMLVGAVKLAPELPLDGVFPFLHGDRSFMHLGFHIYDLGFQSQNSEAAKPMVFTTTLLLIVIIALLNVTAVWLRSRLRKQFQSSEF